MYQTSSINSSAVFPINLYHGSTINNTMYSPLNKIEHALESSENTDS